MFLRKREMHSSHSFLIPKCCEFFVLIEQTLSLDVGNHITLQHFCIFVSSTNLAIIAVILVILPVKLLEDCVAVGVKA